MASNLSERDFVKLWLKLYRRRIILVEFGRGIFVSLAYILPLLIATATIEYYFWIEPPFKTYFLSSVFFIAIFILNHWCGLPFWKKRLYSELAVQVEHRIPECKGNLIASVDESEQLSADSTIYSSSLITGTVKHAATLLTTIKPQQIVNHRELFKTVKKMAVYILSFIVIGLIAFEPLSSAWGRLSHPLTSFKPEPKTILLVHPGDTTLVKGDTLRISVKLQGERPRKIALLTRKMDRSVWERQFRTVHDSVVSFILPEIRKSFSYYVRAAELSSEHFNTTVIEIPFIQNLSWVIKSPGYARQRPKVITENIKRVDVLPGSSIKLTLRSNKALEQTWLVFNGSKTKMGKVDGNQGFYTFRVYKKSSFHIKLRDKTGVENREFVSYKIGLLHDELPHITIEQPGKDVEISEEMKLPLKIALIDDYGISKALLHYRVNEDSWKSIAFSIPKQVRDHHVITYAWDLESIQLLPGDYSTYYASVFDNDVISGPKKAVSKKYHLRYPSLDELIADVEHEFSDQVFNLEDIKKKGKEINKQLEQAQRELLQDKKLSWEKKQEIQSLVKQQKDLAARMEKISKAFEKSMQKLSKRDMLSLEVNDKMHELKKLMNEVATDEMKSLMQKIKDSIDKLDKRNLSSLMKNFKFSQEKFLEKLDRTLSLLKKMKAEQKLGALQKKLQDVIKKQNAVNEKLQSDKANAERLTKREKSINKEAQKLKDDIAEAAEMLKEFSEMTSQALNKAHAFMDKQKMSGNMKKMASQLGDKKFQAAQTSGANISRDLEQLSSMLADAQNEFLQSQKAQLLQEVQKIIHNLHYISHSQEALYTVSRNLNRKSKKFSDVAEDQQTLFDGLNPVTARLMKLSQNSVFIPNSIQAQLGTSMNFMQKGIKGLENRNSRWAALNQKGAITSVNSSIVALRKVYDFLQKLPSMGQSSFLQQLQGMAQKQGGLNQSLMDLMQGQGMSMQARSAMARLAAEQEGLRKQLDDLYNRSGEMGSQLGDLGKIMKDMEEVVKDLRNKTVTERTFQQQRSIFNRLLDSQRSVQKKEYSKQREAQRGKDIFGKSPQSIDDAYGENKNIIHDELMKALNENYPSEYKELIRAYFKRLAEEYEPNPK